MFYLKNPMKIVLKKSIAIYVLPVIFFSSCYVCNEGILADERDGKEYPVVQIGDQCWMAENLAYLPYVYPSKSDSGYYVYGYEGNDINAARGSKEYQQYGVLYNWAVAMNLPLSADSILQKNDKKHRGICPRGWHLPSNDEVLKMEKFLETTPDFSVEDERRNTGDVGKKLKSTQGWFEGGNGTDEAGFSALPSGIRYQDGFFTKEGKYGYFWTSTDLYGGSAFYRYMVYNNDGTFIGFPSKKIGMPVRCLKD